MRTGLTLGATLGLLAAGAGAPLAAATADAPQVEVGFATPAQADGTFTVAAAWVLILLAPGDTAALDLGNEAPAIHQEHRLAKARAQDPVGATRPSGTNELPPGEREPFDAFDAGLRFQDSWAALLVSGPLTLRADAANGTLRTAAAGDSLHDAAQPRAPVPLGTFRDNARLAGVPEAVLGLDPARSSMAWHVDVEGPATIEWHNATLDCRAGPCPTGGRDDARSMDGGGVGAGVVVQRFGRLESSGLSLAGSGSASYLIVGSDDLALALEGQARLPDAEVGGCTECPTTEGQTLALAGSLQMGGMRPAGGDRMQAEVSGALVAVRIDEQAIDPAALGWPAAAAVAATATALLVGTGKLLASLATRLALPRALQHPRRRQIHDFVRENPACSFGQLRTGTGLSNGVLHHHLGILQRGRIVTSRTEGNRTLFVLGERRPEDWGRASLLSRPELRSLLSAVERQPGLAQGQLCRMFPDVKRPTLQYRVGLLVDRGLLRVQRLGREVRYYPGPVEATNSSRITREAAAASAPATAA